MKAGNESLILLTLTPFQDKRDNHKNNVKLSISTYLYRCILRNVFVRVLLGINF